MYTYTETGTDISIEEAVDILFDSSASNTEEEEEEEESGITTADLIAVCGNIAAEVNGNTDAPNDFCYNTAEACYPSSGSESCTKRLADGPQGSEKDEWCMQFVKHEVDETTSWCSENDKVLARAAIEAEEAEEAAAEAAAMKELIATYTKQSQVKVSMDGSSRFILSEGRIAYWGNGKTLGLGHYRWGNHRMTRHRKK